MITSPTEKIEIAQTDAIVTLTLNRPEVLNAIDREMLDSLETIVTQLHRDTSVRALILTGSGERAFCVGADLKHIATFKADDIRQWVIDGNRIFSRIASLPVPVIAAINGYAIGGGLELAMTADLRFASDDANFSMPEVTHGWVPGWGGTHRLLHLIGEAKAKELVFLGERIDAETACQLHLVNRVINKADLMNATLAVAESLASKRQVALQAAKAALTRNPLAENGFEVSYDGFASSFCFTENLPPL